jgi:hypothetical protein
MAEGVLQKVLERAFSDPQFRSRLATDLDEALVREGYKLSSDERRQLKGILDEGRESFATGLDQRLSQSGVSLSPQALLRQKSKTADQGGGLLRQTEAAGRRKQPSRQAAAAEGSGADKRTSVNSPLDSIDEQEPDYEVETD